jgi:XisH protein
MAYDNCHQQIVSTLLKAAWVVDDKQVYLRVDRLTMVADIRAQISNGNVQQIIIVEVKCFADPRNDMDELYRAVGQYLLYRSALQIRQSEWPIYLAIPTTVYNRLFVKPVVQSVVTRNEIKLIVVDVEREEIVQWLT